MTVGEAILELTFPALPEVPCPLGGTLLPVAEDDVLPEPTRPEATTLPSLLESDDRL